MVLLITFNRDESPIKESFINYYSDIVDRIQVWDISEQGNMNLVGLPKTTVIRFHEEERNELGLITYMDSNWKKFRNDFEVMIVVESDEILFSRSLKTYIDIKKKDHTLIEPQGFQMYVDNNFDLDNIMEGEYYGRPDGNYSKPVIIYLKNLLKLKFMEGFKLINSIKSLKGEKPLRNTDTALSFPIKLLKLTPTKLVTEEHLNRKIRIL
jgi:hypothetical protein